MRKPLLLALAVGLGSGVTNLAAQVSAAPAGPSISVTTTVTAVSQYMFRGLRLSDGGLQPSVEVSAGNLVAGVWATVPFDGDKVPDSSDPEIDFYGVYNVALEDGLTLTPGFTLYHYPQAPTNAGFYRNTFEPSVALSWIVDSVKLTPKVYYDVVLKGPTYELTASYAFPLKEIGSELGFTLTYGGYKWKDTANDASPEVKAWGQYWLAGVAAPFQLTPTSKLTIGFAYTEGTKAYTKAGSFGKTPNSLALGRGVATLSYSLSF